MSEAIVNGIKNILLKLDKEENKKKFRNWEKIVAFYFSDIEKSWYSQITEGKASEPIEGKPEKIDIQITTDSETWLKIINKEIKMMNAFTSGKLKVKASMKDILKLQQVL